MDVAGLPRGGTAQFREEWLLAPARAEEGGGVRVEERWDGGSVGGCGYGGEFVEQHVGLLDGMVGAGGLDGTEMSCVGGC